MSYESYKGHYFLVNDAPARMMSRELAMWFLGMGVWRKIAFVDAGQRDEAAQYNQAIKVALASNQNHFVFCDSDIRPDMESMVPFWSATADVVGAKYPTENLHAWDDPAVIHGGMWRTRREVLEALEPPYFEWEFDAEHTHVTKCLCWHFCDKVRAAGFTVAQAGTAKHEPRTRPSQ